MPTAEDIKWFKQSFAAEAAKATAGTPYDLDMLAAIASQETGFIWSKLRKKGLPKSEILALCVGDVITGPRRKAFPTSEAELIAKPNGRAMYDVARQALVDMAKHFPEYAIYADKPHRFCHGYGIFQYDLQFFTKNPDYFLKRQYADFEVAARRAVQELSEKQARNPALKGKAKLTDAEMAQVAIAYNSGSFDPSRGLKQGHRNAEGRFYGELFAEYLRLARTIANPGETAPAIAKPAAPGQAPVPPPTPITAKGDTYRVDTTVDRLLLRAEPRADPNGAIVTRLPDGHLVRALGEPAKNGYLKVETSVNGAHFTGFAAERFLVKVQAEVPVVTPAAKPPKKGAVAAHLSRKPGSVTRRNEPANAHSLNEPGQPGRAGTTAPQRVAELAAIVDWLDVENPTHVRYQPRDGLTFCNIYAHDFCHLAGVYLPRVWWRGPALVLLGQGKTVEPLYDATVEEVRANALLKWLDDFGPDFGWRRTSSLTTLQQEADLGAIGLVVARRVEIHRPGHIAIVVAETAQAKARRDAAGEVISPVQSQAGSANFRRRATASPWWTDAKFAENAYWLHA